MKPVPVVEIFGPTIQGEASLAGRRTMFVRTGFCDGAGSNGWCKWCDSLHAVDPVYKNRWRFLNEDQIVEELEQLAPHCRSVSISGGNPALHDLTDLVYLLHERGYFINVETQGTVWRDWLADCDSVTISPKPPSAGSEVDLERLQRLLYGVKRASNSVTMKIVVDPDSDTDYDFMVDLLGWVDENLSWTVDHAFVSTLTLPTDSSQDVIDRWSRLIARVTADERLPDVGVLPQLHVLVWGHKLGV